MTNGMNITNLPNSNSAHSQRASEVLKAKASDIEAGQNANAGRSGDTSMFRAASDSDSGVSRFQEVYNQIAQCNKIAQSKNGAENRTESDSNDTRANAGIGQDASASALLGSELLKQTGISIDSQNSDISAALEKIMGASSSGNADTAGQSPAKISADAAAMISQAIAAITDALHLKVQNGLDSLGSITPSQTIVDQFAEMLSTLKGIAAVLDKTVSLNQPLEYKNLAFDVPAAAQVQQTIHEQMFKIEMALKMMGISGDVAASMDQKENAAQDAVSMASGIPQATDPSKLFMPAIHVKQVLGEQFISKEQKVETLLSKLGESLKNNGSADSSALLAKIAKTANGAVDVSKIADSTDVGTLDSAVMRKILNVDAVQATALENKNAAQQNAVLGLPKQDAIVTSKALADAAEEKAAETASVLQGLDIKSLQSANGPTLGSRTSEAGTMRQLEDSVVSQVADKLNIAVKTGVSEIRVMLRPESLGEVQLKIKVDGDVVMGKMYVESQQVKHIVEANLQTLKDSLSQHNLTVGSFDVSVSHGDTAQDQMRDLADMAGNGNNDSNKENGHETDTSESQAKNVVSGIETGRKFGTNTIEYFA